MKNLIVSSLSAFALLVALFPFNSLSAQDTPSILASAGALQNDRLANPGDDLPIENKISDRPIYRFELSAGQQNARFDDLDAYVAKHLTYTDQARINCTEGAVKVLVVISPEGKVLEASVLKSPGKDLDAAVLDMVRKMPDWTPAMNYGIPVKGKAILEVAFSLR